MSHLYIVGTGPGHHDWLPPKTLQCLEHCSDIVGYDLYFDLLGDHLTGKTCHKLPLGEEIRRAEFALNLAAEGKNVAIISSGDAGIYAMASVAFELLDRYTKEEKTSKINQWDSIQVEVIPGITAMQMASSKMGAAMGHDFCAISLSDLLTPWETIETRIRAATMGDFVVAFYNPVSQKRNWQLNKARDILLNERPASTPVILGKNLTRENESIDVIFLEDLNSQKVDMLTLVLIGNSETKQFFYDERHWVYTPRGYSKKLGKAQENLNGENIL